MLWHTYMNAYQANLYLPLIAAGLYLGILILPHIRRRQEKNMASWLVATLIASIGWEFSLFFANNVSIPNFPTMVLILSLCALREPLALS